ncbi:MAG: T9SS type A sorting domain-containing protein [Candidatus Eisenbacteria bacterium]|uniref:T9SS type A sorting domain-containing protein n=1 Tax=Eiseniibacteriota bacterium TaxID=2212470 RepID=A0A933SGB9_UNCEI|nr:T9SS type A sorting domain-containing protein [Candidatus Eisenbacteria bacterium]
MDVRSFLPAVVLSSLLAAAAVHAEPRPPAWAPAARAEDSPPLQVEPDMPAFLRGRMDRGEYLARRQGWYDRVRGTLAGATARDRVRAVQHMRQQVRALGPFGVGPAWTALGPQPIPNGQTSPVVAVSGRVTCIAVDPEHADTVYVGTAQGGVYRSFDGGANWTSLFDGAASLAIGALALAPSDPSILYVGTGESSSSCDSYFGVGLYRIDGVNATPVLTGPIDPPVTTGVAGTYAFTGRSISRILVSPSDPADIWVATATGIGGIGCDVLAGTAPPLGLRGLYHSTNATAASPAFTKVKVTSQGSVGADTTGNVSIMDMAFTPEDPNVLLCYVRSEVGVGGVWRTSTLTTPTPSFSLVLATTDRNGRGTLTVTPRAGGPSRVLLATSEPATGTGCTTGSGAIRRSQDGGLTFGSKQIGGGGFCGGQCWYDIVITADPQDTSVVHLGGSADGTCSREYIRSVNAGVGFSDANWSNGGVHADCHAIVCAPSNPSIVYMGNDGGIYRSSDRGVNWVSRNTSGFSATQFQSLAVHPYDPHFTIGGTQDNGTNWMDHDASWLRADFGDGGFCAIDQGSADTASVVMYHTYFNVTNFYIGLARVTTTACARDGEWAFRGAGYVDPTPNCEGVAYGANNGIGGSDPVLFYAPVALGPGTPNTVYFGTSILYRSANRGDTMTPVSQTLSTGGAISAIGIAAMNDDVRIAGTEDGKLFATTTGSSVLTDVRSAGMPTNFVSRAVIDPADPNTAYVAFAGYGVAAGQHIWRTRNLAGGASTWEPAGAGLPDVPVNAFVVDSLSHNYLYAGTDIGVYVSSDFGTTWTPLGTGLPVVAVFDMAIQPRARLLRIATHGRGLWEYPLNNATAALASLMEARVECGRVHLRWQVSGDQTTVVTLQRRSVPGEWESLGELPLDGVGTVAYEDADVIPGARYEYALRVGTLMLGRVSVDVGAQARLAIGAISPNPSTRGFVVSYTLASDVPATLDLVDVSGRRVFARDLKGAGEGQHDLDLRGLRFAPGLYWARLQQGGHLVTKRVSVVR